MHMNTTTSWDNMYLRPFRDKAKKLTKKVCEQNDLMNASFYWWDEELTVMTDEEINECDSEELLKQYAVSMNKLLKYYYVLLKLANSKS